MHILHYSIMKYIHVVCMAMDNLKLVHMMKWYIIRKNLKNDLFIHKM